MYEYSYRCVEYKHLGVRDRPNEMYAYIDTKYDACMRAVL